MIWFLLKNLTMHLAALSSYETKFLSQLSVIRPTYRPNNIISICNHMNTSAIWEIIPWSNFLTILHLVSLAWQPSSSFSCEGQPSQCRLTPGHICVRGSADWVVLIKACHLPPFNWLTAKPLATWTRTSLITSTGNDQIVARLMSMSCSDLNLIPNTPEGYFDLWWLDTTKQVTQLQQ